MKYRLGLTLTLSLLFTVMISAPLTSAQSGDPVLRPVVGHDLRHDTSPPLKDLARTASALRPAAPAAVEAVNRILPIRQFDPKFVAELKARGLSPDTYYQQYLSTIDPVVQTQPGVPYAPVAMPTPQHNFAGVSQDEMQAVVPGSADNYIPPDTVGDIGYDPVTHKKYYVQWVNTAYAVWDVTALAPTRLITASGNALWSGFGGVCETTNDGDPIVLFDQLAQRWFMSQFALPGGASGYHQCIAVSQTADPTGAWHRYDFRVSATKLNDYPHFGVWPDAYYMSVNQFTNGISWGGAGAFAFDRARILNGQPATFIAFDLYTVDQNFGGQLPADWDGATPPPAGAPNTFLEVDDSAFLGTQDALRLWRFHVDWVTPANSTFGVNGQPDAVLNVAPFNLLCLSAGRDCIPQPDVSSAAYLDAVADRLMHRAQYRIVDGQERLVVNHTVDAGSNRAGIRWYELRNLSTAPVIYQQGTYAPADGLHRWMGSAALDHMGNLALGYSVSSASVYPGVRYAGRLAADPLNILGQGEAVLVDGGGSQLDSASRWGDYSAMSVDPLDDCTFWYTQEYYPVSSGRDWHTRIGSFRFANCSLGPQGTLNGTVTHAATHNPIAGARLNATLSLTQSFAAYTDPNGAYNLLLPVGTYTLTAAAYGYFPATLIGVQVVSATTTTQAIALNAAPAHVISGTVIDSATHDPLYATLSITGTDFNPPIGSITTTASGFYSLSVAEGQSYGLTAAARLHLPQTRLITPAADATQNFELIATTQQGGLIGWVRNFYTSDPIAFADVAVSGPTLTNTLTDADGYFEIFNLTPGDYTVTTSAALYGSTAITNVRVLTSNVTQLNIALTTARLNYAPATLARSLTFGDVVTDPQGLIISNTGLSPLTWAWQGLTGGFTPLQAAFNSFLVVNANSSEATIAMVLALNNLGYTCDYLTSASFTEQTLDYLRQYQAILFLGDPGSIGRLKLQAYLDVGGRLLIADNDLGFWNGDSDFYTTYLQASYQNDDALGDQAGSIVGEGFMSGLTATLSADPFPDYYTPASSANIPIFRYDTAGPGDTYPAGSRIARQGYRAVYLAFDYNNLGTAAPGEPIEVSILERSLAYLLSDPLDQLPWLTATPLSGTLPPSATQAVQLTWNAAAVQQPGIYTASIRLDNNDPATQEVIVPVALTVTPAANQGLLTGSVSTTGVCDVSPAPLTGATVQIAGQDGYALTLATNAQGLYRYWLMQEHSPYSITVSYAQHPTTTAGIALSGGSVVTQNFTLRLQQPCASVEPAAITATAAWRASVTRTFTLTSSGALPLDYQLYVSSDSAALGGPDAFGYTWLTTTYQFEDASDGNVLVLGDDDNVDVTLPFTFPFYYTASAVLNIGNNGWAVVGGWQSYVTIANMPISDAPNNFLSPFWDDLNSTSGAVYWTVRGSAPQQRVIVEWQDRPHYPQAGSVTFELILYENGNILYQYQDVDFDDPIYDFGASATVGIRGSDAAHSLQYSFDTPSLHNDQAICFVRPGNPPCNANMLPWLSVTPISGTHLIGTPPTQQAFELTLDAAHMPAVGVNRAQLFVMHNGPQPPLQIPVTFIVSGKAAYLPVIFR